ncbi:acyltransferase family protein [Vibrio sp. OPT10]|uniref:acyltransferase family protein n=1 Tax=Vibrio sp. OPT10 TaxID=2778640 RepID=UPI00187EF685|nr:acyltransferase [Vibrio sp. OPT10]MBE8607846.1 acyltransferase [Vibrio sp. OPT10]
MIKSIQALRAFSALFVVFYHVFAVQDKFFTSIDFPEIFKLGKSGVDMFFVISGFIMVLVTKDTKPGISSANKFLIKRFVRIYPIYWFYSLLVLAVYLLYPSLVNSSQDGQVNLIESFLLFPQDVLPLLMVGWTLTYEVYFYILFFFCLLFFKWHYFPIVFLFLGFLISIFNGQYTSPYLDLVFNALVLEFILGALLAYVYICVGFSKINIVFLSIFSISALFISFEYVYLQGLIDNISSIDRLFYFGVPCALILLSCVLIEKNFNVLIPDFIVKLGDSSYSLYLSHILVINAYCLLWGIVFPNGFGFEFIKLITMLMAVIIYSYFSFVFIERKIAFMIKDAKQTNRCT